MSLHITINVVQLLILYYEWYLLLCLWPKALWRALLWLPINCAWYSGFWDYSSSHVTVFSMSLLRILSMPLASNKSYSSSKVEAIVYFFWRITSYIDVMCCLFSQGLLRVIPSRERYKTMLKSINFKCKMYMWICEVFTCNLHVTGQQRCQLMVHKWILQWK